MTQCKFYRLALCVETFYPEIMRHARKLLLLISLTALLHSPRSQAFGLYFDLGVGMGTILKGSGYFADTRIPAMTGFGYAANFGTYFRLLDLKLFTFLAGVQIKNTHGWAASYDYDVAGVYPGVRLDFERFYVGGGYAPLMFSRSGPQQGFDFGVKSGAMGLLGEFGLNWLISPEFTIALQTGAQYGITSGSPAPAADFTIQLRFLYGSIKNPGSERKGRRNKFDGWRYPFGLMR